MDERLKELHDWVDFTKNREATRDPTARPQLVLPWGGASPKIRFFFQIRRCANSAIAAAKAINVKPCVQVAQHDRSLVQWSKLIVFETVQLLNLRKACILFVTCIYKSCRKQCTCDRDNDDVDNDQLTTTMYARKKFQHLWFVFTRDSRMLRAS